MSRRNAALLLAVVAVLLVLVLPARSLAGTYLTQICTSKADGGSNLQISQGSGGFTENYGCGTVFGGIAAGVHGPNANGLVKWSLAAPAGTTIARIEMDRTFSLTWEPHLFWSFGVPALPHTFENVSSTAVPLNGHVAYDVNGPEVLGQLFCNAGGNGEHCTSGGSGTLAEITLKNIKATMSDTAAPTVTMTPPSESEPLRGTVRIPYVAEDRGSGVFVTRLRADFVRTVQPGTVVAEDQDPNRGACPSSREFIGAAPCSEREPNGLLFDTTKLPDGVHTITAIAADAAGNEGQTQTFTVLVHNAPTNTKRPALAGEAKVGKTLTAEEGTWEGSPTVFGFQWLRCPPGVADGTAVGCTAIQGATEAQYAPTELDVGLRLVAKVSAMNAFGSEPALSPASDVVPPVPPTDSGPGKGGETGTGTGPGQGKGSGPGNGSGPSGGTPPQTKIVKHPPKRAAAQLAKFTFTADQAGSSLWCKLDNGPFKLCRSPYKHEVKPGHHTFQVAAVNGAGERDTTPAVFKWVVGQPK